MHELLSQTFYGYGDFIEIIYLKINCKAADLILFFIIIITGITFKY